MANNQTISVARDFTKFPAGRFRSDGDYSGQHFREDLLVPAVKEALEHDGTVTIELDGTLGYGSSFLEEAFGGLVRESGFSAVQLNRLLQFHSSNDTLVFTIKDFIREAKAKELVPS